ncbi:MAG: aspartyl protease family protein [Blastocatellia bacterium]
MMNYSLNFNFLFEYNALKDGITIPVGLSLNGLSVNCEAKVDTGAQVCLFERELGESLGLNIESGHRRPFETLTGSFTAYGHHVTLHTVGLDFDSMVYFAANDRLPRNLLGREGWMQKIRLAIVDYDSALYLGHYDFV